MKQGSSLGSSLSLWRQRGELMSGGGKKECPSLLQRLMELCCVPVRLDPEHDRPH